MYIPKVCCALKTQTNVVLSILYINNDPDYLEHKSRREVTRLFVIIT